MSWSRFFHPSLSQKYVMLKIGSLKLENCLIMAPMAGITNLPFRLIAKKMGAGLVTTEMISAAGLIMSHKRTSQYLKSDPYEKPLSVQLFGSEPAPIARACQIAIDSGADMVDINMGCPVKKVVKTGAGGFLLRTPEKIRKIVGAVRNICTVPLTVKIRTGWSNNENFVLEIAQLIEGEGADAITIHPRYVTQGFSGSADWSIISMLKDALNIPVIGSGDIVTPNLALQMKRRSGCDGIMIGRGAIGNPWIFQQIQDLERSSEYNYPTLTDRKSLILEHFILLTRFMGEIVASRMMRNLLIWYTKGLPNSCSFRRSFTSIFDYKSLVLSLDNYFLSISEGKG